MVFVSAQGGIFATNNVLTIDVDFSQQFTNNKNATKFFFKIYVSISRIEQFTWTSWTYSTLLNQVDHISETFVIFLEF